MLARRSAAHAKASDFQQPFEAVQLKVILLIY
jgi:hypothetical protein